MRNTCVIMLLLSEQSISIDKQGMRALNPIMGIAMKKMRGKASGEMILPDYYIKNYN